MLGIKLPHLRSALAYGKLPSVDQPDQNPTALLTKNTHREETWQK